MRSHEVARFKSGMEEAMAWFKKNHREEKMLAINPIALVYASKGKLFPFNYERDYNLKSFQDMGLEFIVIDPQAYSLVALDRDVLNDLKFPNLCKELEGSCEVERVFDNYTIRLQQWLLLEHARDLKIALSWLKQADEDTGKIKIYNIKKCSGNNK